MVGSVWQSKAAHLLVARKQEKRGKGQGSQCALQGHISNDVLPPTKPIPSRFHYLPIPLSAGDQASNTQAYGASMIQTITNSVILKIRFQFSYFD
jgi:hypothetical protein